jgi:type IV pilus assembly protein PilC
MLFKYEAIDKDNNKKEGTIDALNQDVAIAALQRRGLIISSIYSPDSEPFFKRDLTFFQRVSTKEIVILSRQISTLFEAQVSALRIFKLLSAESTSPLLQKALTEISSDLQAGSSISKAMEKHPKVFSKFYVGMVKSGEEAGRLDEIFLYLADYLDRTYEVTSKARNALIYPAFVITTFIIVMVLMLTTIIPKIGTIIQDSGQEIPTYTKVVLALSSSLVDYGLLLLILIIIAIIALWQYVRTEKGRSSLAQFKLSIPYIGNLYQKLYLSRIADNMHTMILSGISMVKALETTADVVDNALFEEILTESSQMIKSGSSVSDSFGRYEQIPGIMVQMVKIGEETGELGNILSTLAKFYRREVTNAVDTLVDLIEPVMIVLLGVGVSLLLASVLIPIYNIAA